MTRTILFTTRNAEVNPMFVKLRDKYSVKGEAIGEVMRKRAQNDGYGAKSSKKIGTEPHRDITSESRITKANSLPRANARPYNDETMPMSAVSASVAEDRKAHMPIGSILMMGLCAMILMLLIYIGMNLNNMTHEITAMNERAAELKKTEQTLIMKLDDKNDLVLIEDIATNELGMVRRTAIEHRYATISAEDSAVAYEGSDASNPLISGLLSAFFEGLDK